MIAYVLSKHRGDVTVKFVDGMRRTILRISTKKMQKFRVIQKKKKKAKNQSLFRVPFVFFCVRGVQDNVRGVIMMGEGKNQT